MDDEVGRSSKWRRERAHAPDAGQPFSPGDCSVLVIYAVEAFADEPDARTPRFVVGTLQKLARPLADGAPNLMEQTREDLVEDLARAARDPACDAETAAALREAMSWCEAHERFLVQLEPPSMAELGVARERAFAWEIAEAERRRERERTAPEVRERMVLDGVRRVDGKDVAMVRSTQVVGELGERLVALGERFGVDAASLQHVLRALGGHATIAPTIRILLPERRIGFRIRQPKDDEVMVAAQSARAELCRDDFVREQLVGHFSKLLSLRDARGLGWFEVDAGDHRASPGEAPTFVYWSVGPRPRSRDRALLEALGVSDAVRVRLEESLSILGSAEIFGVADETGASGLATLLVEYAEAPAERIEELARELGIPAPHLALLSHHEALRAGGQSVMLRLDAYALHEELHLHYPAAPLEAARRALGDVLSFTDLGAAIDATFEETTRGVVGLRLGLTRFGPARGEVRLYDEK